MPKPRKKQIKPIATEIIYHCKDCTKSYDWHSKALDGHLILCRCPHKQEGGRPEDPTTGNLQYPYLLQRKGGAAGDYQAEAKPRYLRHHDARDGRQYALCQD